jgi:hypothetical protein
MEPEDFEPFAAAFRRLALAFNLRLGQAARLELTQTYFRVLDEYPLAEVLMAGRSLLQTHTTMPKVAEWLARLHGPASAPSPAAPVSPPQGPDVRTMSVEEVETHARAVRLGYEDTPCICSACEAAGVSDRPRRFVPTLWPDDSEQRAYNPRSAKVETLGHWAHGDELRRWYEARQRCFDAASRYGVSARVLTFSREPGEED